MIESRERIYEVLAGAGGKLILRCKANGIIPERQADGETRAKFIARCQSHCRRIGTAARPVRLVIEEEENE